MEPEEFNTTFNTMLDDVATIIHNQKVLANVRSELNKNKLRPFEQDFIYKIHYGSFPSEPKTIEHNGVTITTRVLHQTGIRLSDIAGTDLLYEIEGEKFGIVQYKLENNQKIKGDKKQLEVLLDKCPEACWHKQKRPNQKKWLPLKMNGFCGSWYSVLDAKGVTKFVHACEAEAIFQNANTVDIKEFQIGLANNAFLDLFSGCRIGALLRQPSDGKLKQLYLDSLVESNHLVFEVKQQGKWSAEN